MKNNMKRVSAIAAVAALACTGFTGCNKQIVPIQIADYVELSAEGCEILGKLEFEVDTEELVRDNCEAFGFGKYNDKAKALAEALEEALEEGALSKTESLMNGDTVTLTWDANAIAVLEEEHGFDLVTDPLELTVEGFDALTRIDPFENDAVYFGGTEGYGYACVNTNSISVTSPDGWYSNFDMYYTIRLKGTDMEETVELTNLKNGDVVVATASYFGTTGDEMQRKLAEDYQVICTATEKEYTVDCLAQPTNIDLFEGVTVKADDYAVAPFGTVSVDLSDATHFSMDYYYGTYYCNISDVTFSLSAAENLKNGDIVTVTAMYNGSPLQDVLETFIAETGYTTDVFSKEFTVSDMNSIVTTLEEIDQATLDTVTATFTANRQAEFDGYPDNDFVSATYIGSYLFSGTYENVWREHTNSWYACYEVKSTGQAGDVTYYSFINYENVDYTADGVFNIADKNENEPEKGGFFIEGQTFRIGDYTFVGFQTKEALKSYIESQCGTSETFVCNF